MSAKDYIDTVAPTPNWLKAIGSEAKQKGLNKLSMRHGSTPGLAPPGAIAVKGRINQPGQMIRLVLDTNIIVSTYLNEDGLPFFILKLVLAGLGRLYVSEPILAEYQELLIPADV